jgi:transposase
MSNTQIEAVTEVTPELLEGMARLIPQLSSSATIPTEGELRQILSSPAITLLVARTNGTLSGMVAAIGNGAAFQRGRDFGAWLGLVPKQTSTGGRTILGRLSKRGNSYLRSLLVQAARVLLLWPAKWRQRSFGSWLIAVHTPAHNVLAAALANKLARIAWSVLSQNRVYEPRAAAAAG